MLGAVIGDIVGSIYEFDPIKTKDFSFLGEDCFFTDDTVCTAAVADILVNDRPPASTLQDWCRRHPSHSYGDRFTAWIHRDPPVPYGSFGNGAAMRVSPAAFLYRGAALPDALAAADRVTEITHDHPEGIKGARAATHAIWLAFAGADAARIRETVATTYGYDLSRGVDDIRPDYDFDETCQGTVPQAIICALEASSFEDAVRNAISLGGDADTLAAIAGPVAEAMHGIPDHMQALVEDVFLADAPDVRDVLRRLYAVAGAPRPASRSTSRG